MGIKPLRTSWALTFLSKNTQEAAIRLTSITCFCWCHATKYSLSSFGWLLQGEKCLVRSHLAVFPVSQTAARRGMVENWIVWTSINSSSCFPSLLLQPSNFQHWSSWCHQDHWACSLVCSCPPPMHFLDWQVGRNGGGGDYRGGGIPTLLSPLLSSTNPARLLRFMHFSSTDWVKSLPSCSLCSSRWKLNTVYFVPGWCFFSCLCSFLGFVLFLLQSA